MVCPDMTLLNKDYYLFGSLTKKREKRLGFKVRRCAPGGNVTCKSEDEINSILSRLKVKIYNSQTLSQATIDTLWNIK